MKKTIYIFIFSFALALIYLDHDQNGIAYNPLFHSHTDNSGNATQSISMPCGLGGSENHKH